MLTNISFLLSKKSHDKLSDLSRRGTKTSALIEAIETYTDDQLTYTPARTTSFNLPPEIIFKLDEIKAKNNLKSRNQTVEMLIDLLWAKHIKGPL
ncbi:hypothetical protein [Thauera sinica]|uniref:Ribbon-helix-helix protein CopG domain-containing protein n=1 Tax=Thauera sinica TaxID=2665146 RepID=A0ABW1APK9_9RHOO|nr:hypothetical protein [Thauera sp. K11]